MHVLEAALFANIVSTNAHYPRQWRPECEQREAPRRHAHAAVARAVAGLFAAGVAVAALGIVYARAV